MEGKQEGGEETSLDPELLDQVKRDDIDAISDKLTPEGADKTRILFEACRNGASRIVEHVLETEGSLLGRKTSQGNSLLHLASQSSNIILVERLVEKLKKEKMDIYSVNDSRETSLHVACGLGTTDVTMYLIEEARFDHTRPNKDGLTVLHISCKVGKLQLVKYFTQTLKMDPCLATEDNEHVGSLPVHFAAMHGRYEITSFLIEECGCDPHAVDNRGRSLVYLAADGGNLQLMKYLVETQVCDPHHRTKPFKRAAAGRSPMHSASFQGHLDIVKYLVGHCGCGPGLKDNDDVTPLACAAQEGEVGVVKFLSIECKVAVDCQDSTGRTPLHYACLKGRIEVIKFLVEQAEADVNRLDNNGETPVIVGAKGTHREVVDYLIRREECTPLNDSSQSGRSVLHYAANNDWLEIVKYLSNVKRVNPEDYDSTGISSLHHAADGGSLEVLKYFIEDCKCATNQLSEEGETGNTPFLRACSKGRMGVVKYLFLERGCSLTASKGKGMHPIHLGCSGGHIEVVKFLLEGCGQSINMVDKQGAMPIHFSVLNGHLELSRVLIDQYGADPMKKTHKGATAVYAACQGGHLAILKYLIEERKCHRNDSSEAAVLHIAAEHGHLPLVKYLIEELVSPVNHRNSSGRLALHYASWKGHLEMTTYLLEISCDVMVQDSNGAIPLHLACSTGQVAIIKLLLQFEGSSQVMCKDTKGLTPLKLAKQEKKVTDEMLRLFLSHGADSSDLMDAAPESCGYLMHYEPLYSFIKIFLVGEYESLVQELQELKGLGFDRSTVRFPSFPIFSLLKSDQFSDCIVYEIPTVAACYSNLITDAFTSCQHPVFVICLDSYKKTGSILRDANHWLNTFTSAMKESSIDPSTCKPLLLFEMDDNEEPYLGTVNQQLLSLPIPAGYEVLETNQIVYSRRRTGDLYGAKRLLGRVIHYSNALQSTTALPPLVSAVKAFIASDLFKGELFCTLQELVNSIDSSGSLLPKDLAELTEILTTLCKNGFLLFIRNPLDVSLSWLILEDVPLHIVQNDLTSVTFTNPLGLIKQSDLLKHCTIDPSLFLSLLKYTTTCVNLSETIDPELCQSADEGDNLYCFPHLLLNNPPQGLTLQTRSNQTTLGWLLQCNGTSSNFSSRFTELLPCIIPLCVDPLLINHTPFKGSLWKNGVHWVVDGMKMAVLNIDNEAILAIVKGASNRLLSLSRKRNQLVLGLRKLIAKFNEDVVTKECLLNPKCLKHIQFSKGVPPLSVVPLATVETDYKEAERSLGYSYREFVGFEPYHILKQHKVLNCFFNEEMLEETVSDTIVDELIEAFAPFSRQMMAVFEHTGILPEDASDRIVVEEILRQWIADCESSCSEATYRNIGRIFSKYSMYTM